jgi:hypothetical protein
MGDPIPDLTDPVERLLWRAEHDASTVRKMHDEHSRRGKCGGWPDQADYLAGVVLELCAVLRRVMGKEKKSDG